VTAEPDSRARRSVPWLVVCGVLLAAMSLRGPIVAPTPVLAEIESDLGIGSGTAGLLTTAPVLMFALLTPLAALVIRRAGAELALLISLSGVLIGTFIRALPGFGWMLAGMLVIGASITIGNVVVPVIIRRDVPPDRVALVTAAYVATLNAGSLVTALLTAPLAAVIGWPMALLVWSVITFAGIVLWGIHLRVTRRGGADGRYSGDAPTPSAQDAAGRRELDPAAPTGPLPVVARERSLLRRPVTWLLAAAFAGQCTMYYSLSTWLPTLAADELGLDATAAGALASLYQGAAVAGAFLVPLLMKYTPRLVPPLTICASWIIVTVGILLWPELMWLWLLIGAVGHAGGFVVIFTTLLRVARSDAEAAGMSAFVQGSGYAVAALGAPLMGWLREVSGGWMLGLALMVALAVAYCVALLAAVVVAGRPRS
jgi:MFS transporter, CP family, cyanate transporter